MEFDKFIQDFATQFEETDSSIFSQETKFKDLEEWSSLMALNIIAFTDEEYHVKIKGMDIRSAETIKDLYNTVVSKM